MNPALQSPEVMYLLRKVDANAVLMTEETFKTQNYYELMKNIVPELGSTPPNKTVISQNIPTLTHVIINSKSRLRYGIERLFSKSYQHKKKFKSKFMQVYMYM